MAKKLNFGTGIVVTADEGASWVLFPWEISNKLKRANRTAMYAASDQMIKDTEEFVPARTGLLRASAEAEIVGHGSDAEMTINYSRPILILGRGGNDGTTVEGARWVYQGLNPVSRYPDSEATRRVHLPIQHYTTDGTGPYWFEESWNKHNAIWLDKFGKDFVESFVTHRT